ncbi:MAG TPA: hypothetical protein VGO57_11070 [Verrucomicrobiae bacterium]|jgi:hypothetical protein
MKHTRSNQETHGRADLQRSPKPVKAGLEPLMEVELIIQDIRQRADHVGPLLKDILQVGHGHHTENQA